MSLSFRWLGVMLGLLVVLGTGLRFQNLEHKSLWSDELFTLAMAHYYPLLPEQGQPFYRRLDILHIGDGDTFLTAKAAEQSPPLNDLLEKVTVSWLGATEFAARLPAALSASMLLLWFAGFAWRHPDPHIRRVLGWSVLLLVLHPALVLYAKDGRAYSIGVSTVGMAGLLWMLRWRDGWRAWQPPGWVEIGLFAMACYSHYNAALLVVLLLSADAVMATKLRSRQAWVRLLALGLSFLVWLVLNAHTILFTSKGGVAWGTASASDFALMTLQHAPLVMHTYWLALALLLWLGLLLWRWRQGQPMCPRLEAMRLWALVGLTLLYAAFAGLVAAKAGMAHPRYYIFVLPFVVVAMGLVLAELRHRWLVLGTALMVAALAVPSIRGSSLLNNEDFRAMTLHAVRVSDNETLFLYPWVPNRNMYRVYLERFLGTDPRSRMVGVSSPQDALDVCDRLTGHTNVVAIGHDSGKGVIDAVYAACGEKWPQRSREQFHNTFAEHWKTR